jgi:hypothetical protein
MQRYTYEVEVKTIHGLDMAIGRLYQNNVLVHECTVPAELARRAADSCYRHYVRLAELDEIEMYGNEPFSAKGFRKCVDKNHEGGNEYEIHCS